MNVFSFFDKLIRWGNKPECQSCEHFEVLLHAGVLSIWLTNSVCCSFWMYDGKPLSKTGWLSCVVLLVDELNDHWKFCWEFSIGYWDVIKN